VPELSPEEVKDEEGPCIHRKVLLSIKMKDFTKSIQYKNTSHNNIVIVKNPKKSFFFEVAGEGPKKPPKSLSFIYY
jgi:hypothetical protein